MKLINPVKREVTTKIVLGKGNCGCPTFASQAAMLGGSWAQFYKK